MWLKNKVAARENVFDFVALKCYTLEKQKEAAKMMNNKFYFYFYYFEKGCPLL